MPSYGIEAPVLVEQLSDPLRRISASAVMGAPSTDLPRAPGLYAWWVDGAGALDLSTALGIPLAPGLIYAGQAGATRWPSGKPSPATLASRIRGGHLGSSIDGSTFRLTLAALLCEELGLEMRSSKYLTRTSEEALSRWMREHLAVSFVAVEDGAALGRIETEVLRHLDPPLNLDEMPASSTRERLSQARRGLRTSNRGPASQSVRVGLVGCVKTKGSQRARAQDLYRSPLFHGRRGTVEATCDRWFVLSAKYGLVAPERRIDPYDVTLTASSVAVRRRWAARVIGQLERSLGDLDGLRFDIHAGSAYVDWGLVEGLRARGAQVRLPTAGLPLGAQLAYYRRRASRGASRT